MHMFIIPIYLCLVTNMFLSYFSLFISTIIERDLFIIINYKIFIDCDLDPYS